MSIQFENFRLKNKFLIDRPILVKQGQVTGNKNIFNVGPSLCWMSLHTPTFCILVDNAMNIDRIRIRLPISYFKGSQVEVCKS